MTEKRFRVQEHCLRSSYGIEAENWLVTNDNHIVVLNNKAEAHMVANMCNDIIDVLNEQHKTITRLEKENEQLKQSYTKLKHRHGLLHDECLELEIKNDDLKQWQKEVFEVIDEKIKHYEHKPFSAPVGQPMSVNFDADVDRLARLSELQDLEKELKMND